MISLDFLYIYKKLKSLKKIQERSKLMKQINHGYANYYYLLEDGSLYNADIDQISEPNINHTYILKTIDNRRKKVSLKTLYKLVYDKPYSKDKIEDLDNEQWKEIDDTEHLYYISNKGRVKSFQGYETIILKPFINQSGYGRVDIIESGRRQTKLIHRLVAAAFLPLPQKLNMQLHHKDFDKDNNAADNLQWLSPAIHYEKHKKYDIEGRKENVSTKSKKDIDIEKQ